MHENVDSLFQIGQFWRQQDISNTNPYYVTPSLKVLGNEQ